MEFGARKEPAPINAFIKSSEAVIGNVTEYAPYVQGSRKEKPGQSRVMQRKGWQSVDDVAKSEEKAVAAIVREQVAWMLRQI